MVSNSHSVFDIIVLSEQIVPQLGHEFDSKNL